MARTTRHIPARYQSKTRLAYFAQAYDTNRGIPGYLRRIIAGYDGHRGGKGSHCPHSATPQGYDTWETVSPTKSHAAKQDVARLNRRRVRHDLRRQHGGVDE